LFLYFWGWFFWFAGDIAGMGTKKKFNSYKLVELECYERVVIALQDIVRKRYLKRSS